jgi:YozE SAM-like fold
MTAFTDEQILTTAEKHNVVPNGFNVKMSYGGPYADVREKWAELGERGLNEVRRAAAMMEPAPRVKTKKSYIYSYGLKHRLEQAHGEPGRDYICNGAAIVAAYLLGIDVQPESRSPNGCIAISRAYDFKVREEPRPGSFSEWVLRIAKPRDKLVRDFVEDARSDKKFPRAIESEEALDDYLRCVGRHGACREAREAAKLAFRAYERSRGVNPSSGLC